MRSASDRRQLRAIKAMLDKEEGSMEAEIWMELKHNNVLQLDTFKTVKGLFFLKEINILFLIELFFLKA